MLDKNGQPAATNFNLAQNVAKSLLSLQGILKGLVADKQLNELELIFLSTWIKSHRQLERDGDVLDLLDSIDDIVADGIITADELADLQTQIEDVIEYGVLAPQCVEDLTNELLGFVSGISADNIVTLDEMTSLVNWLNDNPDAVECWPGNVLHKNLLIF